MRGLVKVIANLKKRFVIQVEVVWKPCAEYVLEMALLGEKVLPKLLSQSDKGR